MFLWFKKNKNKHLGMDQHDSPTTNEISAGMPESKDESHKQHTQKCKCFTRLANAAA